MATQDDSTNQDRDTGGKHDDETGPAAEPEMSATDFWQEVDDRLRFSIGALVTASADDSIENFLADTLNGVEVHLRQARENLDSLWKAMRRRGSQVAPRDLANGYQREDEKRELVRRLLPLSHDDMNDVMMISMMLSQAEPKERDEDLKLMAQYPLRHVLHFQGIRDKVKASESAVPATD
jgi:paraquat-inducible protein B